MERRACEVAVGRCEADVCGDQLAVRSEHMPAGGGTEAWRTGASPAAGEERRDERERGEPRGHDLSYAGGDSSRPVTSTAAGASR